MVEYGTWSGDPLDAPPPQVWLESHIGPRVWSSFLDIYAGRVWRVPAKPYYTERNEKMRGRFRELEAKGVRYTDCVRLLADEFGLSQVHIRNLIATFRR